MKSPILLISDLDEHLLGDPLSVDKFREWMTVHRPKVKLVYLTAASTDCIREETDLGKIASPDFVIACGGTEVDCFNTGKSVEGWPSRIPANWDSRKVRDVLTSFPELELHPEMMQSRHKVSYFLERANSRVLAQIKVALTSAGLEVDLSYVRDRFLDVLPRGIDKARALDFLAQFTSIPSSRTIVCGGSLGDLALYGEGNCGVITASADADLRQDLPDSVYRSSHKHAAGILDGLRYWLTRNHDASGSREAWRFDCNEPRSLDDESEATALFGTKSNLSSLSLA